MDIEIHDMPAAAAIQGVWNMNRGKEYAGGCSDTRNMDTDIPGI